jgi:hypothetical protein
MDRMRHAHLLARAVLAWFVFTVAAAVAAPAFKASQLESICTGSGGLVLVDHGGAPAKAGGHVLDCPLCASLSAPPVASATLAPPASPRVLPGSAPPSAHAAGTAASTWPRGPPACS